MCVRVSTGGEHAPKLLPLLLPLLLLFVRRNFTK